MFPINGANTIVLPSGRNGFRKKNKAAGISGTEVTEDWANDVQEEIINVLVAAGIVPAAATRTQLRDAIQALIASGRLTLPYLGFRGDPVSTSLPNNVQTRITSYSSIINNLPSASYSNGVITIGRAGHYLMSANLLSLFAGGLNYGYALTISRVDGSNAPLVSLAAMQTTVSPSSVLNLAGSTTALSRLAVGDRISVFAVQNSGSLQTGSISLDIEYRGA